MAIAPISAQSTSAVALQNQKQRLLNQIKHLQRKTENAADANAAQIKILQQKYNTLLLQHQPQSFETKASVNPSSETKASQTSGASLASSDSKGIDIEA